MKSTLRILTLFLTLKKQHNTYFNQQEIIQQQNIKDFYKEINDFYKEIKQQPQLEINKKIQQKEWQKIQQKKWQKIQREIAEHFYSKELVCFSGINTRLEKQLSDNILLLMDSYISRISLRENNQHIFLDDQCISTNILRIINKNKFIIDMEDGDFKMTVIIKTFLLAIQNGRQHINNPLAGNDLKKKEEYLNILKKIKICDELLDKNQDFIDFLQCIQDDFIEYFYKIYIQQKQALIELDSISKEEKIKKIEQEEKKLQLFYLLKKKIQEDVIRISQLIEESPLKVKFKLVFDIYKNQSNDDNENSCVSNFLKEYNSRTYDSITKEESQELDNIEKEYTSISDYIKVMNKKIQKRIEKNYEKEFNSNEIEDFSLQKTQKNFIIKKNK